MVPFDIKTQVNPLYTALVVFNPAPFPICTGTTSEVTDPLALRLMLAVDDPQVRLKVAVFDPVDAGFAR
jgi:hypothetical protein